MNLSKEYKSDIRGDAEIWLVVDAFYTKIRADENLAPIFADRVKDWSTHMPQMYAFWGRCFSEKKSIRAIHSLNI
jgi:truncated hemoglobin YjbI